MNKKFIWILVLLLTFVSLASCELYTKSNNNYNNAYGYGMMGNDWGTVTNRNSNTLTAAQADKDMEASLTNATIDKNKNTITYSGDNIKVVIFGGPEQADGKFVIGGLINPTIYISKNTNVTIEFINEDEGMEHNVVIINSAPPYAYMSMMQGEVYPGSYTEMLPEATDGTYYSDSVTFYAGYAGNYYYICQYPGHAANGMYGEIVIQ